MNEAQVRKWVDMRWGKLNHVTSDALGLHDAIVPQTILAIRQIDNTTKNNYVTLRNNV